MKKYKVANFNILAKPMNKYTYLKMIDPNKIQHLENKWIKGFYCNWNGYTFWLREDVFNKLYILDHD